MNQKLYHFLALISPDREVYVASTALKTFRTVYKDHWCGKHLRSAQLFYGKRPRLFLLETVEIPTEKAAARRILWSRRFYEAGYTVIDWTDVQPYVDHPHPHDASNYASIQALSLDDLCAPMRDLSCDFVFAPCPHTIKLEVSSEEWADLQRDAADKNLSLSASLRERFYSGSIQSLSLSELRSCEQQCRQVVTLLEREARLALLQGSSGPAIESLLSANEDLRQKVQHLTTAIRHYVEVINR